MKNANLLGFTRSSFHADVITQEFIIATIYKSIQKVIQHAVIVSLVQSFVEAKGPVTERL